MKSKIKQTLWVESISLTKVDGKEFIPTKLYYNKETKRPLFGSHAQTKENCNENFKIDLGNITPSSITVKKTYKTATGEEVNARRLTKDFLDNILYEIENRNDISKNPKTGQLPIKIIMAEPLSFQVKDYSSSWITNYRSNIRKILSRYEIVDFLPEPFAVYQFYRYGLRIPQLSDSSKHIALIIDFGGGTFDACVIESTKEGDVSIKGRHSKPVAADSEPTGGFYINQQIAEYLIFRDIDTKEDRTKANKAINLYQRLKKGDQDVDFDSLNDKNRFFIKNFEYLLKSIENYKIELTNKISDWSLKANDKYVRVSIKLPTDPFSDTDWHEGEFFCHEFRKIYISKVWNIKLSKIIKRIISISRDILGKEHITTTLLSGGSSNIRWLDKLLLRDFEDTFKYARPVPVSSSFQEIVAKGLAIECARRYYDDSSEFVSVTYNPLKLILNPDNKGNEEKKFISLKNTIDMEGTKPGDLMPSAQVLLNFIDRPIQWKVTLSSAPKNSLKFYFTKSGDIDTDYDCYNVENTVVYTKNNKNIASSMRVELTLSKDGTVYPKFIYKTGYKNSESNIDIPENSVLPRPFAIDMTSDTHSELKPNKYIGIDFGTSNSSICEITNKQIDIIEHRASEPSWVEIKESICDLPYPVAHVVRKYLDVKNADNSVAIGREAFEAILSFAAYIAAAEVMANGITNKPLQNFAHRSLGPLRELLEKNIKLLGNKCLFSKGFKTLLEEHSDDLSRAIDEFTDHKHDKLDGSKVDVHNHLKMAVNICRDAMRDQLFGFCYSVNKVRFKNNYKGLFKLAHDEQFFTDTLHYIGDRSFSDDQALIYNKVNGKVLTLTPLIIWFNGGNESRPYSCSLFDKYLPKTDDANLKPCDKKEVQLVSNISDDLKAMYSSLKETGICPASEIIPIQIKDIIY